jgi:hypothetical protein
MTKTVRTSKMAETVSVTIWHQNSRNLCACELSNAKSYKPKSKSHIPEYYSQQGGCHIPNVEVKVSHWPMLQQTAVHFHWSRIRVRLLKYSDVI